MPWPLVLASRSPRRRALLSDAGIHYELHDYPEIDETPRAGLTEPLDIVRELAERKARAAALKTPHVVVLAADTLVFLEGEMLGKPEDGKEARNMLRALSGRTHEVATGVALAGPGTRDGETRVLTGAESTRVTFRDLTDDEIAAYVAGGEPLDKAGAYAIQGGARRFVRAVDGEEDTVIGLPVHLVQRLLADW
ncbi:MAG: Maf family protein [Planctomycetota bacterium]|nr:Maf family protein [Planctomycetota bacterium]